MAFSVQNDSGTDTDANAYVDDTYLDAYVADRGLTLTGSPDATAKQQAIVLATDYLDQRFNYVGERSMGASQTTAWPRINAYDIDGNSVDGIPLEVKKAICEYAIIYLAQASDLNPTPERDATGRAVISKSDVVGPIEEHRRYGKNGGFEFPRYPKADQFLFSRGLVRKTNRIFRG